VLLLDEIEKAHPDMFSILLQVMDHATLTDSHGRKADFRHVELIMTTNAGARDLSDRRLGFAEAGKGGSSRGALERTFTPEFRNRLDAIVNFSALETPQIERVVDKQIDELLERRVGDMISDRSLDKVLDFAEDQVHKLIAAEGFETKVHEFVAGRFDDLPRSQATPAETFTPETIAFIKDRIDQQVPPIVHHLAEIATSQTTRKQIGGLIKLEVDQYYEQLSLLKKIFISRERIHREVDELVNKTLPRRVEEYLRGPAFEQEAESFLNATIDNVMARPLDELIGQFDSIRFEDLKSQISNRLVEILRSEALSTSVSMQVEEAIDRLRPQTLGSLMQQLDSNSTTQAKEFLTKGLLGLLARDDTARTINAILSTQIERLLISPIGRLGDHVSRNAMERASSALVERITLAARERLPVAIAEFDVGGLVRKKVSDYPLEKLEDLVLSVARDQLKTIEIFGAVIGFFIGVAQAIYFWFTYVPGR